MRKSIQLLELGIYLGAGIVFGLVPALAGNLGSLLVYPLGALACYVGYLVSIRILADQPLGVRIGGAIAVVVMTGGAWLAFFIPGELIRRFAMRFYRGSKPVETVFGPIEPETDAATAAPVGRPRANEEAFSERTCPSCGQRLRKTQVENMIGNPRYEAWSREGYCSLACYEKSSAEQPVTGGRAVSVCG